MISYTQYAKQILLGGTLEDKLLDVPVVWTSWESFEIPKAPGRVGIMAFSERQQKFPKNLFGIQQRAQALHSFANHELLAIEMMATALLIYPHQDEESVRFKKGILSALKDEQKHLSMYIKRINELGYSFGDFPLNDFFWRQMEKLKTPSQYMAMMALTFEAANLDFAQYYKNIFKDVGDHETEKIMEIVLEDEITHVAFGVHWMKRWKGDESLWKYYRDSLPFPLTPARSKGIGFDATLHAKAMNDDNFICELKLYDDDFKITKRSKT